MLAEFPVRRPIVAMVISILIVILGLVAYPSMPVAQYPDITPPVIQVTTVYPGASAQVVADTVAAPIEQEVNGVPGMIYMESTSASNGSYTLDVTFELGTDIDIASVLVQNRVNIAMAKLPEDVTRQGVTTDRVSSSMISVYALSPKEEGSGELYDDLFLTNYLTINTLDEIKRIDGVGDVMLAPSKDYALRVWLDPDRLQALNMTTLDVIAALREQNVQVAAGAIGQPPVPSGQAFQYNVSTLGRLSSIEEFEDVIVRAQGTKIVRVKDIARVEIGGKSYDLLAKYGGTPAAVVIVYLAPGGNAVEVAEKVQHLINQQSEALPDGLAFTKIYDTSEFVLSSIEAVFHTFVEALLLVLAVVVIFLGSLRLSVIPMLAIPVSIIGTFFFASILGFSVNMPVLFGLVVAIGIVVDDAIVVVENVERVMVESHLSPKDATIKAMKEVLAPVISITMVLLAVFIPTVFLPGISGELFKQFAITIAASTFLSGVCAVTLTPALCGLILKPHKEGKKQFIVFRWFNRAFDALASAYARLVTFLVHPAVILFTLVGFGLCMVGVVVSFNRVPTGFVPVEDRGLVLLEVWLPDSASQERTEQAVRKVEAILAETDGVEHYSSLTGFSIINDMGSNYATLFAGLEDWSERLPKGRDYETIMSELQEKASMIMDGVCIVYTLPAIDGLGNASGFDLRIQDRSGIGRDAMGRVIESIVADSNAQSKLSGVNSGYRASVPQLFADIDREKVKTLDIPLQDVFGTMTGYLAPAYVNDFNLFGRTWQVMVSADTAFRTNAEDIEKLNVRKPDGSMVPLGSLLTIEESTGADRVIRYNIYPAAVVQGQPAGGVSSGDAMNVIEDMADTTLPEGTSYQWTSLSYQEKLIGNQAIMVFAMALLVVYLLLAALYESWFIPLSVILSIPLAVLGAMGGLMLRGMDNNIYTQVGLVLLVGLGAKNAILIVEFAKAYREEGKPIVEAATEAARQRLRPILMTAFAFILGVTPLVIATGAGAASRQAIGTAVFFGMIGNTFLGLIFTPVLYVVVQRITEAVFGSPTKSVTVRG